MQSASIIIYTGCAFNFTYNESIVTKIIKLVFYIIVRCVVFNTGVKCTHVIPIMSVISVFEFPACIINMLE